MVADGDAPSVDVALAVRAGLYGLVFVAPAAVAGLLLADDEGDLATVPSLVIVLVQLLGFCFAGWVVRRFRPDAALATASVAGLACWAILQAVGVVTTLARGDDLAPLTWVATALVAALTATAGGLLARYQTTTPRREDP